MDEFIYWAHPTAVGIRVEEVSGGTDRHQKAWLPMAKQIFAENGKNGMYREVTHSDSGAPLLADSEQRISVTHTPGLLAVAMLPKVPGADLNRFSLRTALGIDAEHKNREQVLKIRGKFLSEKELTMIPDDDVEKNILAWTVKEAVFKAILSEGVDFIRDIRIESLPEIAGYPLEKKRTGRAVATRSGSTDNAEKVSFKEQADGEEVVLDIFSYRSEDHIVTLAYSPNCAIYKS